MTGTAAFDGSEASQPHPILDTAAIANLTPPSAAPNNQRTVHNTSLDPIPHSTNSELPTTGTEDAVTAATLLVEAAQNLPAESLNSLAAVLEAAQFIASGTLGHMPSNVGGDTSSSSLSGLSILFSLPTSSTSRVDEVPIDPALMAPTIPPTTDSTIRPSELGPSRQNLTNNVNCEFITPSRANAGVLKYCRQRHLPLPLL